jgi:hypothetical protein
MPNILPRRLLVFIVAAALAVVVGVVLVIASSPEQGITLTTPTAEEVAVLVGAGDIALCSRTDDEATAALLDTIEGTVFTTGDNVYTWGTLERYQECYEPSWGRHKARTRPAIGGHDYPKEDPTSTGYWEYFGEAAGEPGKGYYSYDLGAWHIIVLNSMCDKVPGGCGPGSPQEQWLRADLAAHPTHCTLAYFHKPRFSSGEKHGSEKEVQAFWEALYEAGVEAVLNGDEHQYERFAPQDPNGEADPERGIREFVIGTGGARLYPFDTPIANSEVRNNDTHGVLKLTLQPTSYTWEFVPVAGQTFTDTGSAPCHD